MPEPVQARVDLPRAFRDPELRDRLSTLYVWWYRQNLKALGLAAPGAEDNDMLMGLAELIAAIPDGLSVQAGLNPEGFELTRPLATLEFLLRNSMAQLVEMAAEQAQAAEACA